MRGKTNVTGSERADQLTWSSKHASVTAGMYSVGHCEDVEHLFRVKNTLISDLSTEKILNASPKRVFTNEHSYMQAAMRPITL
jgi:hypothetical protein